MKMTYLDWVLLKKCNAIPCIVAYLIENNGKSCEHKFTNCMDCKYHIPENVMETLCTEYKGDDIPLTQMEKDVLETCDDQLSFNDYAILILLHSRGYYKAVRDLNMTIEQILMNCSVVRG